MSLKSNSFYANAGRNMKADLETVAAHEQLKLTVQREVARVKREQENNRPTVTVPEDAGAVRIRHMGWFVVVRVNRTSVTVKGALDDVRFPLSDVVGVAR